MPESTRSKKVKIGLVGCGYIAEQVHLPVLHHLREANLVAVCDVDAQRMARVSKQFGIKNTFLDLGEMLAEEELDLVDICTPPQTHASVIIQALKSNVNCLVEKPLTATVEEADEVIELAKRNQLKLFVIHNYSYVPAIRRLRRIIHDGRLGKISLLETHYFAPLSGERYRGGEHWIHNLPGGVLNSEILPHLLMLTLEFMDEIDAVKISVMKTSRLEYVKADELQAIIKSRSGTVAHVGLSFNSTVPIHTMEVTGSKGVVLADLFTQSCVYHKLPSFAGTDELALNAFARGKWAVSDVWQSAVQLGSTSVKTILGRYKMRIEGHKYLMRRCLKCLLEGTEYPVDLEKCKEVVWLVQLVGNEVAAHKPT